MARGEHTPACSRQWRDRAAAERWTTWRTTQAIHACCGVSLLKAHRLARGWTVREAVEELLDLCEREQLGRPKVSEDLLNVWENGRGRPRPETIDLLARLYQANAVRLGLAEDYTDDEDGAERLVLVAPTEPGTGTIGTVSYPATGPRGAYRGAGAEEGLDEMERRALFHQVLAGAGLTLGGRFLAAVEKTRQDMDRTLATGTVTEDQMDRLEETVLRYRHDYLRTPPLPMLCQLVLEFADVRNLAAQRQPAAIQRRLSRVTALLAVLSADALMKLGDTRQARAWYATARTAADDTSDPRLRALVRAQEAMLPYYYGSLDETVRLAREARALARNLPCSATALAAAAEARALARQGNREAAETAMREAQRIFSQTDPSGQDHIAFAFTEQRLLFYLSGTLTYLGESRRAAAVQQQALASYPPDAASIDPALIRLDQAICLVHDDAIVDACQLAAHALQDLPAEHRTPIVLTRARDLVLAVPPARRDLKAVRQFREAFALDTAGR